MKPALLAFYAAVIVSGYTASLASSSLAAGALRELTDDERQLIAESLSENIREPAKAKSVWAPLPANAPTNGRAHYCAAVNAKSPYAPYNGLQPYLVQLQISNGQIVSAVLGSIAGGKDARIVRNLCAKHGLNPDDAV